MLRGGRAVPAPPDRPVLHISKPFLDARHFEFDHARAADDGLSFGDQDVAAAAFLAPACRVVGGGLLEREVGKSAHGCVPCFIG